MIEPTISYGTLLSTAVELLIMFAGGVGFFYAIRYSQKATATELKAMAHELVEVKIDIKELTKIITIQAVQDEKIVRNQEALAAFRAEYNERHKALRERIDRLEQATFKPTTQTQQRQSPG